MPFSQPPHYSRVIRKLLFSVFEVYLKPEVYNVNKKEDRTVLYGVPVLLTNLSNTVPKLHKLGSGCQVVSDAVAGGGVHLHCLTLYTSKDGCMR